MVCWRPFLLELCFFCRISCPYTPCGVGAIITMPGRHHSSGDLAFTLSILVSYGTWLRYPIQGWWKKLHLELQLSTEELKSLAGEQNYQGLTTLHIACLNNNLDLINLLLYLFFMDTFCIISSFNSLWSLFDCLLNLKKKIWRLSQCHGRSDAKLTDNMAEASIYISLKGQVWSRIIERRLSTHETRIASKSSIEVF